MTAIPTQITQAYGAGVRAGWSAQNYADAYGGPLNVEAAIPGWLIHHKGDADERGMLIGQFKGGFDEGVERFKKDLDGDGHRA